MRYLSTIILLGLAILIGIPSAVARDDNTRFNNEQITCLALNIYYEARGESIKGQIAVGLVTLNRVASKRFPNTICGVVKQAELWNGNPIRDRCQFSFFCDGRSDIPRDKKAWTKSNAIAKVILGTYNRPGRDITNGAMWYHADYVTPKWINKFVKTVKIGDHIFYAEK